MGNLDQEHQQHGERMIMSNAASDIVLRAPMPEGNDAGAHTVQDYLISLLLMVWDQGEDMVKRPFGNSGWQYEVYKALVAATLTDGVIDEDGCVEDMNHAHADELIRNAIISLKRV